VAERRAAVLAIFAAVFLGGLLLWLGWMGWAVRSIRATAPAAAPEGGARRIVSLAPSLTETLFAIGAGERVVAVTDLCDVPPAARELPKVGGLTSSNLHLESVVAARPDLVVSVGLNQEEAVAALRRLGIAVVVVPTDEGLGEVVAAVRRLGELSGRSAAAEALAGELERRLAAVDGALAGLPAAARPRVYFEVWDRPLMTAGPETFLGEIVERAGGANVFADVRGRYVQVSPETVLARDPEVILTAQREGGPRGAADFAARPGWAAVDAVAAGRVHLLDGDLVSRPGPRAVEALERTAALLHPERFGGAR
jgi:iron complex transport system substrate-binding protein